MPENNGNGNQTNSDAIIKEQSSTIKTLTDQLKKSGSGPAAQPVFLPTEDAKKAPNYLLFIGAGIALFMFLRGR